MILAAASKETTSAASGWIAYAAVAISLTSLMVAVLSYLGGGARIKFAVVYAYATNDGEKVRHVIRLRVRNTRRGDIDILDFILIPPRESGAPKVHLGQRSVVGGPTLTYRMAGLSTEYWEVDAAAAISAFVAKSNKEYGYYPDAGRNTIRFAVLRGDGKLSRSRRFPLGQFQGLEPDEAIVPGRKEKFISAYPQGNISP